MTFGPGLRFNEKGYSQIMYDYKKNNRYRIIKNPSFLTQLYYLTFVSITDYNKSITVKLYRWDRKIKDLDY